MYGKPIDIILYKRKDNKDLTIILIINPGIII